MNYIKRLEEDNRKLSGELDAYKKSVLELKTYLLSDKFHEDPTVQVRDVLNRLDRAIQYYTEDAENVSE